MSRNIGDLDPNELNFTAVGAIVKQRKAAWNRWSPPVTACKLVEASLVRSAVANRKTSDRAGGPCTLLDKRSRRKVHHARSLKSEGVVRADLSELHFYHATGRSIAARWRKQIVADVACRRQQATLVRRYQPVDDMRSMINYQRW